MAQVTHEFTIKVVMEYDDAEYYSEDVVADLLDTAFGVQVVEKWNSGTTIKEYHTQAFDDYGD